jgi:hypothetical protein
MPRNDQKNGSARTQVASAAHHARSGAPPTVSGQWLLKALGITVAGAALCLWLALCLLFWQGSWQLLYHPASAVARTPASAGLAFDDIAFASTSAGDARLRGWWIPAAPDAHYSRYTVLYLHGRTGNMGDTVDTLAALHRIGLNVFCFDYRGYGQSEFAHPSEANWRKDADWALAYLTGTRHIAAKSILVEGHDLGANLALEVAAAHPELAGVVLESPLDAPAEPILGDARARLVPARLLVSDRYDAEAAAGSLLIPSLWLVPPTASKQLFDQVKRPAGYDRITARKRLVRLTPEQAAGQPFAETYVRWLDDLPGATAARP